MAGTLPPMLQIMQDIGGVKMPEYFGKMVEPEAEPTNGATPNGPSTARTADSKPPTSTSSAPSGGKSSKSPGGGRSSA